MKCANTVGTQSSGYDAGKKIKGRKRHILTDTCRSLSTDQRDSALAALIDAHLAAAQPLVQSFQQTVRVLSQGSHQ